MREIVDETYNIHVCTSHVAHVTENNRPKTQLLKFGIHLHVVWIPALRISYIGFDIGMSV